MVSFTKISRLICPLAMSTRPCIELCVPTSAMVTSSIEVEHLRGVATHHLLLVLMRQGPKQGVQGGLRFQPDGPEVREIGTPEHLVHPYVRDGVVSSRISNEP